MATPTTLNIGEPADERSVDGNNVPLGGESESGDQDADAVKHGIKKHEGSAPLPPYPNYDGDISPDYAAYYERSYDDDDDDEEDNDNSSKFPKIQMTLRDILFKIVPSIGAASYEYFSLKITSPSWFLRAFSGVDQTVSNVLWLQAHTGIGLYVFSRRHFKTMPFSRRLLYSTFGSFLFNYGSCLFWALGRSYLPPVPSVHVAFGLISGGVLLYVGQDYLHYIDRTCSEIEMSSY